MKLEKLFSMDYSDYVFSKCFVSSIDAEFDKGVIGCHAFVGGGIKVDTVLERGAVDAAGLRVVGLVVELTVHGE